MEQLTLMEIAQAVGGTLLDQSDQTKISSVTTDTRKMEPGCLFIPIRGERFDGHDYIETALAAGAAGVLSERDTGGRKEIISVADTRKAYLDLAAWYRRRFSATVIGVTGSVGKTTTKEMIAAVLETRCHTLKTEGNHNNEIGLPQTLLSLDSTHQAAVIEMGMSDFGEISRLSRCASPNIGVITNIGVSHIENLGSREGILKAKLELLDGMDPSAPLILNADDDLLSRAADKIERDILSYGIDSDRADIRGCYLKNNDFGTEFDVCYFGKSIPVKLPVLGRHNVLNALAAFSVGLAMNLDAQEMASALAKYVPAGMRQRVVSRGGKTLIEDCYNASPDSMKAALSVLQTMHSKGKKVAVLADMLELGAISEQAHYDVGKLAAESGIDLLLCYGDKAQKLANGAKENGMKKVYHYQDKETLVKDLCRLTKPGDSILFKGSRGMRLEDVIEKMNRES